MCSDTAGATQTPAHPWHEETTSRDQKYSAGSRSGKLLKLSKRKKTKKERRKKPTVILLLFLFFRRQQNWSGS